MKYLRSVIIGMALFTMTISLSGLAFAEKRHGAKGECKCKVASAAQTKTLRDSAAALQGSNLGRERIGQRQYF